ncbi:MAG TPA: hypothetical protein VN752_05385 [Solirubrobacterales bacterium]|nr:hypothetical protein [Solirubrobacterales bacterium]
MEEMIKLRLIKMLGLAGATALAAMAFVGAGTASADSACLVDPPGGAHGMCPGGAIWNGPIIGLSQQALFKLHGTLTTCKSEFLADYNGNLGPHVGVLYLVLKLIFTECVGPCEKAFAENLPYLLLVLMSPNLHAILNHDFNGPPAVLLQNCFILGIPLNCLYNLPPNSLLNYLLELNSQLFPLVGALRANLPLTWAGDDPLCPGAANFEATYLIYEDVGGVEGAELFFTALP